MVQNYKEKLYNYNVVKQRLVVEKNRLKLIQLQSKSDFIYVKLKVKFARNIEPVF